jgi:hypothetical protein
LKHFLAAPGKNAFAAAFLCLACLVLPAPVRADPIRSLEELFPQLGESQRREISNQDGIIRSVKTKESLEFTPSSGSGIKILDAVLKTNPSYLAESLLLIPYQGRTLDRLDAYNALGKIRDLKGRLYHSHTRNSDVPLFEDAVRIESDSKTNQLPDPPAARELPLSDTVYIRLKDVNFGDSYYRGNMSASHDGVTYTLTNVRKLSYLLFTVMKEEKFFAALYIEPLAEGMLVYSVAGADASDFIASKIDIPSAITKRLAVFIGWIRDGIKRQDSGA